MINLVTKLIPKNGFIWRIFNGDIKKLLLDALSEEPKRIKAFLETIVRESNPGTAIDTQEEWYQQYGLYYFPQKSTTEKQAETLERYIALGGQDIVYLQDKVHNAGFGRVTLIENTPPALASVNVCGPAITGLATCWSGGGFGTDWIFYYYVVGTVDNDVEWLRLHDLLQKIAPAHLVPDFHVKSSNNVCGPAECGKATCDG